jgi:hypothetical protein
LTLIALNLIFAGPAHRDNPDRGIPHCHNGRPVFAIDYADDKAAGFEQKTNLNPDPVIIAPQRLRRFEIDPMLGKIRQAFVGVEFKHKGEAYHEMV